MVVHVKQVLMLEFTMRRDSLLSLFIEYFVITFDLCKKKISFQ